MKIYTIGFSQKRPSQMILQRSPQSTTPKAHVQIFQTAFLYLKYEQTTRKFSISEENLGHKRVPKKQKGSRKLKETETCKKKKTQENKLSLIQSKRQTKELHSWNMNGIPFLHNIDIFIVLFLLLVYKHIQHTIYAVLHLPFFNFYFLINLYPLHLFI